MVGNTTLLHIHQRLKEIFDISIYTTKVNSAFLRALIG